MSLPLGWTTGISPLERYRAVSEFLAEVHGAFVVAGALCPERHRDFDHLDAPIARVTGADLPMPYSKPLEQIAFPHEPQIVETVLSLF
jgi:pyruvate/2-oxoglutarate/acetoin dehydrogenase E1 component